MTRKATNALIGATLAVLTANAAAGYYFYRTAFIRRKKPLVPEGFDDPTQDGASAVTGDSLASDCPTDPDCPPQPVADMAADNADMPIKPLSPHEIDRLWLSSQEALRTYALHSTDNLLLKAKYLPARIPTNRTAILVHGYSADALSMAGFARHYHEVLGYNVLLPDNRAHGESEGRHIGFGWVDRLDLSLWIRKAIELAGPDAGIVLHGVSMGGATVLMASGDPQPPEVKAIVSDCAYSSVWEELRWRLKEDYRLPAFPVLHSATLIARVLTGRDYRKGSALAQVARSRTPTLFVHGDADTFVPYEMVHRLHKACASEKALCVIPEAGHAEAWDVDRETYVRHLHAFLNRHMAG